MGFIEETGAAQLSWDVRITPIYEEFREEFRGIPGTQYLFAGPYPE